MRNPLLIQPNGLLKRLYPKAVWNFPRTEKNIYLTFDDGPVPGLTEWVLDELKRADAKATFFCVGDNIKRHPQIYERILAEGHTGANHTMHHTKGFKQKLNEYLRDVEDCAALVNNRIFRPPYGQLKPGQYRALVRRGYKIILWDVISYDYEKISPRSCERNVMKHARPGSIVLFHDNVKAEKNLKHVLPAFLGHFQSKGFAFKRLT